jgi:DNA-directed RNA polymerase specialized sigma24 family protein
MPLRVACNCTLCHIEVRLLAELAVTESDAFEELLAVSGGLRRFPTISDLLSHLRKADAVLRSDGLLRELFADRATHPAFIESLLVLVFLPMLHGTIRRVVKQQPGLLAEDVTQQTLSFLLLYLRSEELRRRESYFAFAIARAVKRQVFAWASREGGQNGALNNGNGEVFDSAADEEPLERYAWLRHFLHSCVTKRLISDAELALLIQFKVEGNTGDEDHGTNGTASNALRQRLKRLLAKLRRLAQ